MNILEVNAFEEWMFLEVLNRQTSAWSTSSQSLHWMEFEDFVKEINCIWVHVSRDLVFLFKNLIEDLVFHYSSKRRITGQALKDDATKSP